MNYQLSQKIIPKPWRAKFPWRESGPFVSDKITDYMNNREFDLRFRYQGKDRVRRIRVTCQTIREFIPYGHFQEYWFWNVDAPNKVS